MTDDLEYLRDRVAKTARAMRGSSVSMVLFSEEYGKDVKSLIEMALSIMLEKPILLVVPRGRHVPEKLRLIADAIEFYDGDSPEDLHRAAVRALEKIGQ